MPCSSVPCVRAVFGGRFRGWRAALGWCGGDKRRASDKARDFGYALFARGLYREGENDGRCCLIDVEEGPVSVCRGHGLSMYVAAAEVQSVRLRLCYFSSCGWFDWEAWSHDRRTDRKHVKRLARLQSSDLLNLKAHDHRLKMMFFSRIERSAKD